jgi:chromosome segregation ATPase
MGEWRARRQQAALRPKEAPPAALGERLTALGAEVWAMARALADEQLVGEQQRLEAEQKEMRGQMEEAGQLADRLSEEAEGLRARLAECQALLVKPEALKARLAEVERRSADELARSVERADRHEAAAAEARQAETAAIERAAHAEGQVKALKDQLAEMTAALQVGARGSRRGTAATE